MAASELGMEGSYGVAQAMKLGGITKRMEIAMQIRAVSVFMNLLALYWINYRHITSFFGRITVHPKAASGLYFTSILLLC